MIPTIRTSSGDGQRAAPAKLNLYLHVTGRRADGYHLLDSLVAFAAVHDELHVAPAESLSLRVRGPFADALDPGEDNLVLRAARRLAELGGIVPRAKLTLTKRLPVASGIGGGSADAAAALQLLSAFWQLGPAPEDLARLALSLGADVPVCLGGRAAFVSGIGEVITPAPDLPAVGLVLANPGRPVSTLEVFRHSAVGRSAPAPFKEAVPDAEALAALLRERHNDLALAAIDIAPEIAAVLAALNDLAGCLFAAVSGSGATCFGLFADLGAARRGADALVAEQPGWWVVASRLVTDTGQSAPASQTD